MNRYSDPFRAETRRMIDYRYRQVPWLAVSARVFLAQLDAWPVCHPDRCRFS